MCVLLAKDPFPSSSGFFYPHSRRTPLSFDILRHALRRYICKQLSTFDADGRSRLDYANPCQISLKSLSHSLMLASFLPVSMPNELIQLITAF